MEKTISVPDNSQRPTHISEKRLLFRGEDDGIIKICLSIFFYRGCNSIFDSFIFVVLCSFPDENISIHPLLSWQHSKRLYFKRLILCDFIDHMFSTFFACIFLLTLSKRDVVTKAINCATCQYIFLYNF